MFKKSQIPQSQFVNVAKISTCNFIKDQVGEYRAIVKVHGGFMTIVDDLGIQANWGRQNWNSVIDVFRAFGKGALQTIQFKAEGSSNWLTVFARSGKKIKLADLALLSNLKVRDVNQAWFDTNLYNPIQYTAVNAMTYDCNAFVKNI
jgi:hypothetical protein